MEGIDGLEGVLMGVSGRVLLTLGGRSDGGVCGRGCCSGGMGGRLMPYFGCPLAFSGDSSSSSLLLSRQLLCEL